MSTMASTAFVRDEMVGPQKAPPNMIGPIGWARKNLFSTPINSVLTIVAALFIVWCLVPVIRFTIIDAVWTGDDRAACAQASGACWAYVKAYLPQFIYGRYPIDQRWRVDIVFLMLAVAMVPMLIPRAPFKRLNALFLLTIYPLASFVLLTGGHLRLRGRFLPDDIVAPGPVRFALEFALLSFAVVLLAGLGARLLGLRTAQSAAPIGIFLGGLAFIFLVAGADFGLVPVETANWGGLLVTLVVAVTGMVASLPLGVLLALGRRSKMPVVRVASVTFIEVCRGVPLITVLFMASVMLPLFLPEGVTFDKLLRALIGVALFQAAYMAEVIRGGLQAIPRGQYEGAMAIGLSYWQRMRLIILPQALRVVIPGIVGSFISLFKDTTLVAIIGLFDLLGQIQASANDAKWASPVTGITGYIFAALVFWAFCFSMSRYAAFTERRLDRSHRG
ncbi:amino acid ABC transporter permease [Mesorhizobium sp. BR1-1-16]|uniref:amino acid ABC transporter permease n=1 Tax=Mesorhizobium sp. BR1-1-16 TaxID=2876653 RepID=UPI001CCA91BE|nr:amino acid ABC transporter permease [Mesorhizobium sp. BR1-1-16]MBZ9938189.1 amino acid ABC transporter permease [Mesorhizobium sp. BR1-1-16]